MNENVKTEDGKFFDSTSEENKKFNEWYETQLLVNTMIASKDANTSGHDINAKNDNEKAAIDESQFKQCQNLTS